MSIFAYAGEKGKVREGKGEGRGRGRGEGERKRGGGQCNGLTSPRIIIFTSLLIMNGLRPGTIREVRGI